MGTRSGSSLKELFGGGWQSNAALKRARSSIDNNAAASVIVAGGISYLAASSPPVATLVAAYSIAQHAEEIGKVAQKTLDEYDRTDDYFKTTEVAVAGVSKIVVKEVESNAIDTFTDGLVSNVTKGSGMNEPQTQLLKSVVSSLVQEEIDERKKH